MTGTERDEGFLERFHDRLVGVDRTADDDTDADDAAWLDEEWPREEDDYEAAWAGDGGTREVTFGPATDRNGEASDVDGQAAREAVDGVGGRRKNVAATLATELSTGAVDERTMRALKREFGIDRDSVSSVRLDALAARISELEAYTDALETLLDRVGTDDDVVRRFDDFESTIDEVAELRSDYDDLSGSVDDLTALSSTVADLQREVGAMRRWQRSLSGALAGVADLDDSHLSSKPIPKRPGTTRGLTRPDSKPTNRTTTETARPEKPGDASGDDADESDGATAGG
jgi:hypothetical protein